MHFEIEHLTRYVYSAPVQLGEHILRFLPSPAPTQQPRRCVVEVYPQPAWRREEQDAWGNRIERVGFAGETERLEISCLLEVDTLTAPPPSTRTPLPVDYRDWSNRHEPYRSPPQEHHALAGFCDPLRREARDAEDYLDALNAAVHRFYHRGIRLDGPPRSPADTIERGEGVCRDLAVLFMAGCRRAGIACRFVSGYQSGDATREARHLHAWTEVLLPAYGWRAYDPTHGTDLRDDHVAIASAPSAAAVTPVEGGYSFYGSELNSTLEADIRILAH